MGTTNTFLKTLLVTLVLVTLSHLAVTGQTIAKQKEEAPWKTVLYQKGVDYGRFACDSKYKTVVDSFFVTNPLRDFLPICHNDCPIISCQPVLLVPAPAKVVGATGTVKVHVLVDELGTVFYARALTGHPLLQTVSIKAACQTVFRSYPSHKRQGIMDFTVERGYKYLGVPFTANQVW